MIRNGYPRSLQAQAARARLLQRWERLPEPVRRILDRLLRESGLRAAEVATAAVEALAPFEPWPWPRPPSEGGPDATRDS